MFNFPTKVRPPGFRVGPLGEPETDEAPPGFAVPVPSFAVPEGDYGPSGSPLQLTPPVGFNFDPRRLVPVSCASSDGSTSCMTPSGRSFAEPIPQGFPAGIDPQDPNYHYYHFQSEPLDIPVERLLQAIVANPTPSFYCSLPATQHGTLNEATSDWWLNPLVGIARGAADVPLGPLPETPLNPVMSYLTEDKDGNPMVVNMTQTGHSLWPGYVVIYVTSSEGKSTIHVEGEGTGELQSMRSPARVRRMLSDDTWRDYVDTIRRRMK